LVNNFFWLLTGKRLTPKQRRRASICPLPGRQTAAEKYVDGEFALTPEKKLRASALPRTHQSRSIASTKAMLDAATTLIAERGFNNVTLADVSKAAGYSHNLVTARFGSKEGLLLAILETMVIDWIDQSQKPELLGLTGAQAVMRSNDLTRSNIARSSTRLRAIYILFFEALFLTNKVHNRVLEYTRDYRDLLSSWIIRGIDDGTIPPIMKPEKLANLIFSTIRGIHYQWVLDPDHFSIDQALQDLNDLLEIIFDRGPIYSIRPKTAPMG
jgi:AcrR family transcriptional regulator